MIHLNFPCDPFNLTPSKLDWALHDRWKLTIPCRPGCPSVRRPSAAPKPTDVPASPSSNMLILQTGLIGTRRRGRPLQQQHLVVCLLPFFFFFSFFFLFGPSITFRQLSSDGCRVKQVEPTPTERETCTCVVIWFNPICLYFFLPLVRTA